MTAHRADIRDRLTRASVERLARRGVFRHALLPYWSIAIALAMLIQPVQGGFHLWQVKEVYSNADGSVQFVEMFDSFAGEVFTSGFTLTANSDFNIKTFTFPSNLTGNTPGSLLIATTGFGSLPGGVTPDFTFAQGGVSGTFFNPNATNISFTFSGSSDSMTITGAALPKDGINSLTDAGAVGLPPGTPNISAGTNSPTNLLGFSGSVNLSAPSSTGDYNGNHVVDAADYVLWRDTLSQTVTAGSGADGNSSGTVDAGDYTYWRSRFGNSAGSGSGLGSANVPEPAAAVFAAISLAFAWMRRRASR